MASWPAVSSQFAALLGRFDKEGLAAVRVVVDDPGDLASVVAPDGDDKTAVAKVIEYGCRLVNQQNKLSTQFGDVADLIREASYWAEVNGRSLVTAADVVQALAERTYRSNRIEEIVQEEIQAVGIIA